VKPNILGVVAVVACSVAGLAHDARAVGGAASARVGDVSAFENFAANLADGTAAIKASEQLRQGGEAGACRDMLLQTLDRRLSFRARIQALH
jgi:hypothetical protein